MSRFVISKYDIKVYPFQEYANLSLADAEALAIAQNLSSYNSWMLPQLGSLFGQFKLTKDDKGRYLPLAALSDNIGKDPYRLGVWKVVTQLKRSSLVKSQIAPLYTEYSALVPLILAGIKKYQNVPYSAWSTSGLEHIMDPQLYQAMTCGSAPGCESLDTFATANTWSSLGSSRLIELRATGLLIKTGVKAGQHKKPTSAWCLTGVKNTEIGELPKLAQTMLTQIWVAHPSLRSPYMVLDPNSWDSMPVPLISAEVVVTEPVTVSSKNPWD